jgi:enoyl-CoA hydratase
MAFRARDGAALSRRRHRSSLQIGGAGSKAPGRISWSIRNMTDLPQLETIALIRKGRMLVIAFNRPEAMNAVNLQLHDDLLDALWFAQGDPGSDLIQITGHGRAFSAGGDIDHIANSAAHPHRFDHEARIAKRIVFTLLDIDKPVICRMNGHAIGLGATIALLCDIIFAADHAKIGDPHVGLGLVAGEYLLTGDLLTAKKAAEIGLINYALPADELDAAVAAFCDKLLGGMTGAIRATKVLTNLELKRIAHAVMDAGIAYESLSVRSPDHIQAVAALQDKLAAKALAPKL